MTHSTYAWPDAVILCAYQSSLCAVAATEGQVGGEGAHHAKHDEGGEAPGAQRNLQRLPR